MAQDGSPGGYVMRLIIGLAALCLGAPAVAEDDICDALDGAIVINADNEYIGAITASLDPDSIFSTFGDYGSKFSKKSIWNKFGDNGSRFNSKSPWSRFSSTPPRIVKDRKVIGYLTANRAVKGGVNISCVIAYPNLLRISSILLPNSLAHRRQRAW